MTISRAGLCGLLAAATCLAQPSLTVEGMGGSRATLSAADLAKFPQHTITTTDHGATVAFEAVALADVLAKVDLPLGEKFHLTGASYYVVAEGRDGYRAVFAWAEVDPGFMDKPIWLALKRDGKALAENAAPFQLVVPGEKRNGRWVRQLTSLRLVQAGAPK